MLEWVWKTFRKCLDRESETIAQNNWNLLRLPFLSESINFITLCIRLFSFMTKWEFISLLGRFEWNISREYYSWDVFCWQERFHFVCASSNCISITRKLQTRKKGAVSRARMSEAIVHYVKRSLKRCRLFLSPPSFLGVGAKCHYDSHCIENAFCRHQLLCFCKKDYWVMSNDHWNCRGKLFILKLSHLKALRSLSINYELGETTRGMLKLPAGLWHSRWKQKLFP